MEPCVREVQDVYEPSFSGILSLVLHAITRAARQLYLLDPPHITPWGETDVVAGPGIGIIDQSDQVGTRSQVESPVPAAIRRVTEATAEMADTFGIPASVPFLLNVLKAVGTVSQPRR